MNRVSIAYRPMKRNCEISIDGEPISEYSDISQFETKDLHTCAIRFIQAIDDELGENYILSVSGHPFQIELLRAVAKNSPYCSDMITEEVFSILPVDEELSFLNSLIHRYSLNVDTDLKIRVAAGNTLTPQPGFITVDEDKAEIFVAKEIPQRPLRGTTVVVEASEISIKNIRGMTILMLPSTMMQQFLDYYYLYCKKIPFIDKVISLCRYISLSQEDKIRLSAYMDQEPKYILKLEDDHCDVGDSIPYSFEVFPKSKSNAFKLTVVSNNISIGEGVITAVESGVGIIKVVDAKGESCEIRNITLQAHRYVTSIRLLASFPYLQVGQKGKIEALLVPQNAEDSNDIEWRSSDNGIVHVNASGEVTALCTGKADITASCKKVSEIIHVEVKPGVEQLHLSDTSLSVELGKEHVFRCVISPEDAAHGDILWELENEKLGTISPSANGLECKYNATKSSLAKGNLRCSIKGTSMNAYCAIQVLPEDKPSGMVATALILTIIGMVFSFLIPVIWAVGGGIGGYFVDILLPASLIVSIIGNSKHGDKVKTFSTCIKLNLICTAVMLVISMMIHH